MTASLDQLIARLSLRMPQRESLHILARLLEQVDLRRGTDPAATLAAVQALYPSVEAFERDFPSLCFALATGVGKTRLMGAFIAWLYLSGRSRHFMVLAPNLTIYEKLKADFRPESPKYVFSGIAELAQLPPLIITGENYEQGEASRYDLFADETRAHVNIFNISKLTASENKPGAVKSRIARIRRLQECIGESYFDYLAGLDDLVLLMDEAHRYRASAGAQALADLRPWLGLELTATPKTTGAKPQPFRNVVYGYTLGAAIRDGLVKIPAVATRRDFDPSRCTRDELERIKLEDGIHHHEYVKGELLTFAATHGVKPVKPFMLVVAQDTTHAGEVKTFIERPDFFGGRYRGRVIEVHSNLKGEESDEAMQRLLAVEHDADTEIVIHVNKLKEGWDVTNLYTIVPLRASASEILTEQTLGRGLRLPYGRRTSVVAIDRLTVIAHDRFQEIVDTAERDDSFIRQTVYIGDSDEDEVSTAGTTVITVAPSFQTRPTAENTETSSTRNALPEPVRAAIEQATLDAIRDEECRLASAAQLTQPEVQTRLIDAVRAQLAQSDIAVQLSLGLDTQEAGDPLAQVVAELSARVAQQTIDVPEIVLIPDAEASYHFEPFVLERLETLRYPVPEHEVLVRRLDDRTQARIAARELVLREDRAEDYLVGTLIERPEIDYDAHAELLYGLAGQVAEQVRSYAADEDEVHRIVAGRRDELAGFVWAQMRGHQRRAPFTYRVRVTRGFTVLRPNVYTLGEGEQPRHFRLIPENRRDVRKIVFGGFVRCCYPYQKFQSVEGELRLAIVLEDDPEVLRWMKPAPKQFRIEYDNGKPYEPDFIVETRTDILMIEPKRASEIVLPEVQAKARAAARWCHHASEHAAQHGSKPWRYLLVPDTAIDLAQSIAGLRVRWTRLAEQGGG